MSLQKNEYSIKIPQDIAVMYCEKKQTLIVVGPLKTKLLRLKLKIVVNELKKRINVSHRPFFRISNAEKKKIKTLRKTTMAQMKHLFVESSVTIFQKLKIVGVGYRADFIKNTDKKLLTLKLGYSHFIYAKISENLSLNCFTKVNFCVFGGSYTEVSQFSARIRAKKPPEPYKGKGVLYDSEKPVLKEGKKV
jgi:large subunit ribosomal protein L6